LQGAELQAADEGTTSYSRDIICPSFAAIITLENKRAQGMPGAGRTREPCVQREVHFAHASNDRFSQIIRHSLRDGVNGCSVLSLVYRAC
jgi:hypothetical protein